MSTETLTATLFVAVVLVTIGITFWASRQTAGAADFYAGGRQFSGFQNGMAVSGDYMSAASFLGISGLIALNGYDGFLYSIGFLVAWLVALLLVAELLRNSGRYTMADQLAYRMRAAPGAHGRRHLHRRRVDLLPAWRRWSVPAHSSRCSSTSQGSFAKAMTIVVVGAADGLLRHRRRHEGHHLGADRQGRAAHGWHRADHRAGARQVRLQPLRPPRKCREQHRQGPGVPGAGAEVRREHDEQDRLRLAGHRAGAGYRGSAAHPDPLLHGAHGQGGTYLRAVGHRPDRHAST